MLLGRWLKSRTEMLEFALGSQASSTALSDRNTATGIPEKHCAMYAVSQYEP